MMQLSALNVPRSGVGDRAEVKTNLDRHLGAGPDGSSTLVSRADGERFELLRLHRLPSQRLATLRTRLRTLAMLDLEGIRTAVDHTDASPPTIALAWPSDADLADCIVRGPTSFRNAAALIARLGYCVGAAHRLGLVHGALVPSRIAWDARGIPWTEFTGTRCFELTSELDRACLPPEHGHESLDTDSDVYSLGMLFLALSLGRTPTLHEIRHCRQILGAFAFDLLPSMLSSDRLERPSVAEVVLALRALGEPNVPAQPVDTLVDASSVEVDIVLDEHRAKSFDSLGDRLGRYRLKRRLGGGGMGIVYEGEDRASGELVAIKVLRPEMAEDGRIMHRFRREARTLDEVRSPYVSNIIEVNFDRGFHYIVMELVRGPSLANVLSQQTRLPESDALEVIADACRALAGPHRWGLIHRDIKPENIMFVEPDMSRVGGQPRVKVCDFGIARAFDAEREKVTAHLTETGSVLGTPLYMAPEQCAGEAVSPATDVYALGITLFTLLTGREPFDGDSPMVVLSKHLYEEAPRLSLLAPESSPAVEEIVARALRKDPGDRFFDAAEMLDSIERAWRGEVSNIEVHPRLPEGDVRQVELEMELEASPEDLWPYVCNSERFNRAVGMAPPQYERVVVSSRPEDVRTVARNRVGGTELVWQESPFEWVEGKLWGSYREYQSGPFFWVLVDTELQRLGSGGTRLRWRMRYLQRNWFMGVLIRLEMHWKQLPALRKVIQRIDALLNGRLALAPENDVYEESSTRLSRAAEERLDQASRELLASGLDRNAVEHVLSFLRSGSDFELARIRPIEFAQRYSLSIEDTITAFLRAAKLGLFEIGWDVLCPLCRVPSDFSDSLKTISEHANCPTCNMDFALDFASSIELVLRSAPSIRASSRQHYCVGGPFLFPHISAQVRLRPGERFALSLKLEPGQHRLRSPQLAHAMDLRVSERSKKVRLDLELGEHCPRANDAAHLAAGAQHLVLTNTLDQEILVRVERMAQRSDALTAARVSGMPVFRELFPEEILNPGQLVALSEMTFLRTELEGSSTLYTRLGDGPAFELVMRHLRAIREVCAYHGGSVLRSTTGGALARFDSAESAARAALAVHSASGDAPVRVSVHRGAAMVATLDERLEFFGTTLVALDELVTSTRPGYTSFGPSMLRSEEVRAMLDGIEPELIVLAALEPDAALSIPCRDFAEV